MSQSQHLPPQALDSWLAAAAEELGLDARAVPVSTVLDVARDVAHGVARPAAPLTTFLIGVAVGSSDDLEATLAEMAERIVRLAEQWEPTEV